MHTGITVCWGVEESWVSFNVMKIYKNPYYIKTSRKYNSTKANDIDTSYLKLQIGDKVGVNFTHYCIEDDSGYNDYWRNFSAKDTCVFFLNFFNPRLSIDQNMFKLTGDSVLVIPNESHFGPIMKLNDSINKKLNSYSWISIPEMGPCYSKNGNLKYKNEYFKYDSLFNSKGILYSVRLTNGDLKISGVYNRRTYYFDLDRNLKSFEIEHTTIKYIGKPPYKHIPAKEKTTVIKYYNKIGLRIRREKNVEIMKNYRI